jgi:DNA modification methylase
MGEIDLRIVSLDDPAGVEADPADVVPQIPAAPLSKLGDMWLLHRHRLLCGSALDSALFAELMGEERAATAFVDPPYNVRIDGHAGGLGAIHHRPFPMASGEMDRSQFTAFLGQAFRNLAAFSIDGSIHFVCMDWRHVEELLAAGCEAYDELKNICVWVKDNAGMGSFYRSRHELVFVFKHGRNGHRNNIQLGQFGRNRSNVWHYPGANSFARHSGEGNLLALHPTVKPVAMVVDAILDCSARGDIVLDAFLGSGTTLIAAERTGRRCYGLELDPIYVDTTIRRWEALTGGSARHAGTGRSFDDLAREGEAANAV